MDALLSATMAKTKPISFRIPVDLYDRLQKVKREQAHPKLQDTEFLVEATKLYIEHAERYGIDEDLVVMEPERPYEVKKPAPPPVREGPRQKHKSGS